MKAEIFKSPLAIGIYVVASLGILGAVGYNYWGWFGGSEKWKANQPEPHTEGGGGRMGDSINCDSTITQNGHLYKFRRALPSKRNDGTYIAQFITDEPTPQAIATSLERTITKAQYDKLILCGGQTGSTNQTAHQDTSKFSGETSRMAQNKKTWKWDSVTNVFGHTFEFSGQNPLPQRSSNTAYVKVLSGQFPSVALQATISNPNIAGQGMPPYLIRLDIGSGNKNVAFPQGAYGEIIFS